MFKTWFDSDNPFDIKRTQFTVNDGTDGINIFIEKEIHKFIDLPQQSSI